jgi:glucose-fructose oxidoreductase
MSYTLTIDGKTVRRKVPKHDQFAAEIVYFSDCILSDREPEPSGEEGLQDVRIVRALYESAKSGRAVRIRPFNKATRKGSRRVRL